MRRFRRSASVLAAVLAFTLIAAACSSDDGDDGTGGDTGAPVRRVQRT